MNKIIDDKYLNTVRKNEEYEVTEYSIGILSDKYDYLKSYERKPYQEVRNQMSTPGAWLSPASDSKKKIDVVADILTSFKMLDNQKFISDAITEKYHKVYHAIGNILPIPEGANYGGGRGSDNYYLKLVYIKEQFEKGIELSEDEEKRVIERLKAGVTLSPRAKKLQGQIFPAFTKKLMLRYWLKKESGLTDWKAYVDRNFLKGNFVDDDYNVRSFNYRDIKDEDLEELIKNIIKRSLQILGEEYKESDVEAIYNRL